MATWLSRGGLANAGPVTGEPPARYARRSASGGAATRGPRGRGTPTAQSWLHEHLSGPAPVGQVVHGVEHAVEPHVLGFEEVVDRELAAREEGEGLFEPVVVVGVSAGDHQLVEQDAVVVEAGP